MCFLGQVDSNSMSGCPTPSVRGGRAGIIGGDRSCHRRNEARDSINELLGVAIGEEIAEVESDGTTADFRNCRRPAFIHPSIVRVVTCRCSATSRFVAIRFIFSSKCVLMRRQQYHVYHFAH